MREIEKQMEWVRSEKDEQIAKLSADRKNLHDRVHEAETQLSQFKARKREELKVMVIVKNHTVMFVELLMFLLITI
jgi:flavorubredoxin